MPASVVARLLQRGRADPSSSDARPASSRTARFPFLKLLIAASAAVVLGLGTFGNNLPDWIPTDSPIDKLALAISAAKRFTLTFSVGAIVALDYALLFRRHTNYKSDEYKADRSVVHLRTAKWILWLSQIQSGIYIKAGQHIASLVYVVPAEFTETLKVLQDRAPFRTFQSMKGVLLEDFGIQSTDELFSEFAELPMAAASLAQVHRAVTTDGYEVAVKIQYPDVARLFDIDTLAMQTVSDVIAALFPDFQLTWIVKEFRKNLLQEFDFTNEALNCEMTAARFAYRSNDIRCPNIHWDLTTRRILTMEFVHGVKVNHVQGIRALGLDPRDVRNLLSQAFAEMIFCHGVVHCDPHAGNAFIVRSPSRPNRPQLVILDHGLYREVSDEFRLLYCQLWTSLVLGDTALLRSVAKRLGVEQHFAVFPLIFTGRPMDGGS
ncbi:ABC1 family-domain-containing protein, partial [Entophlyctis helioformis]